MKRVPGFLILAIACLLTVSSCRYIGRGVRGSGNRKAEKRELAPFKSVDASGAFEVNIVCQQAQTFEIEGDDNILPIIKTEVTNGVLRIHSEEAYNPSQPIATRISVPDLEKFTSAGAGDVHVSSVKNDQLVLSSTGASNIEASGQTKFVEISTSGAGNIETDNLHAERAKITVSGAANVDV